MGYSNMFEYQNEVGSSFFPEPPSETEDSPYGPMLPTGRTVQIGDEEVYDGDLEKHCRAKWLKEHSLDREYFEHARKWQVFLLPDKGIEVHVGPHGYGVRMFPMNY